ncbi:MAG TPA: GAF domain-containing protein [Candidatus Sulfotelmatobacter sp.]|nr:GAF domain-containing protein [Candidatus Sulfotelmatobacter sp.]
MAQRDLDAALQLLADRAQYITGATGAAIALRRDGRNDMLCRASTGPNAPELGALLSTEFGLSGESVRTKQLLRCDDAERDARVNREVCQKLGIASVVVMPVVNDDEVLGVFELFSGKANAFGERDVSAVQRLSEMVETAVRLAQATATLPEKLKTTESAGVEVASAVAPAVQDDPSDHILDEEIFAEPAIQVQKPVGDDSVVAEPSQASAAVPNAPLVESAATEILPKPVVADSLPVAQASAAVEPAPSSEAAAPAKKLFWSAAVSAGTDSEKPAEADQSHIPPMLRALRKCEACGFPITAGRVLCVECEEKKWRGQLKRPSAADRPVAAPAPATKSTVSDGKVEGQALAAAAHAAAKTSSAVPSPSASVAMPASVGLPRAETQKVEVAALPAPETAKRATREVPVEPLPQSSESSTPVVFSGGLQTSQSWFAANKYIIGVLLVVAALVAAFFMLR